MQPDTDTAGSSVVRALLITDLVDSTRLIERLGDRRAARVLAQEEEAARTLAQRYDGQEIDRSDGFLFIFNHAWQAVGFALDYHRALAELSQSLPIRLCGRVGIHVGETYLVANAAEHVARGAKQMEVTGLAKPIAGRLMSAANPGQTLLSGTAHDLARRPCTEQLPPEPVLRWIGHGAYLLKGVEQPVEVFAVAHDEKTAAREPLENDKVHSLRRRQRRRLLLTSTAAVGAAALPVGWWMWRNDSLQRWASQWLVVADWTLSEGDAGLANVLATAFRIALQQSRFAYVMDTGAVLAALQRMRGGPPVDREKALEIARRESAAAAIVPGLTSFDGGFLLSAEVIDAASLRIVAAAQEQIADLSGLTLALDRLATAIRRSVGEPDVDIKRDTQPLAKVTTSNLEALKLYSEADLLMRARETDQAIGLLEQAIVLDPDFASAYAKLGTLHAIRRTESATAERFWRQAADKSSRLSRREQMYVEGCLSWIEDPVVMRARWTAMASAFPDDAPAVNNAAFVEWTQFGDMVAAERVLRGGLNIPHPWSYLIWHHLGCVELGQGRVDDSLTSFAESLRRAEHPAHFGQVRAHLAGDDAAAAQTLLDRFPSEGASGWQLDRAEAEMLLLAYRGALVPALKIADSLRDRALTERFRTAERVGLRARMLLCDALGDDEGTRAAASALKQAVAPELHSAHGGVLDLPPLELLMQGIVAARRGWEIEVDPGALLTGRWQRFPVLQAAADLLRGWTALRRDAPEEALRFCLQGRDQAPLFAFFELEVAAQTALAQTSNARSRARQARARLWQGLAENHSFFATHLGNLLTWQRLARFVD